MIPPLPVRPVAAHKGTFGKILIIGGSAGMIGAPCLSAAGALRIGSGIVRLAVPAPLMSFCLTIEPSAIAVALPDSNYAEFVSHIEADTVIIVGPGLGIEEARLPLMTALWHSSYPLLIDADGLSLLAQLGSEVTPRQHATVLTPHGIECQRLTRSFALKVDPLDPDQRTHAAALLAVRTGAVVALKGRGTVISDGQRQSIIRTGNPALAIPGSGDVLSGMIAGLMAQSMGAFPAATLAAHLHGLAGDLWKAKHGPVGLVAGDLARLIPAAITRYRQIR